MMNTQMNTYFNQRERKVASLLLEMSTACSKLTSFISCTSSSRSLRKRYALKEAKGRRMLPVIAELLFLAPLRRLGFCACYETPCSAR
jgi:hypothetical protein